MVQFETIKLKQIYFASNTLKKPNQIQKHNIHIKLKIILVKLKMKLKLGIIITKSCSQRIDEIGTDLSKISGT